MKLLSQCCGSHFEKMALKYLVFFCMFSIAIRFRVSQTSKVVFMIINWTVVYDYDRWGSIGVQINFIQPEVTFVSHFA